MANRLSLFLVVVYVLASAAGAAARRCARADLVIAIDSGHSEAHPGCVSARGVGEYTFNRRLAERLKTFLFQRGFVKTFIVNGEGRSLPLTARTTRAARAGADLFLSIHHDSVQPRYLSTWIYRGATHHRCNRFHGYSIFYSEKNPCARASLSFAQRLADALRGNGFVPSLHHAEPIPGEARMLIDPARGIYRFDDLVVLKTAAMPAVLLECGIIVNTDEEILLANPVYQNMLVRSISEAVEGFFGYVSRSQTGAVCHHP